MHEQPRLLDKGSYLTRQKRILEQIFGEDWFRHANKTDKNHPAYIRWELCQTLIEQGNIMTLSQFMALARIALDIHPFLALSGGNTDHLTFGLFDLIGDDLVTKRIKAEIKKADYYEDIMVQLYVAAWHKMKGHAVALVEIDGYSWPDIRVDIEIPNIPMLIECKRIRELEITSPEMILKLQNKINSIVYKANQQIKAGYKPVPHEQSVGHKTCYGVLVLDVSRAIERSETSSKNVTDTILQTENCVQRALSGEKNSSVQTAVIVWDTYETTLSPALAPKRCICLRNTLRVQHTNPTSIFPDDFMKHIFYSMVQHTIFNSYSLELIAASNN